MVPWGEGEEWSVWRWEYTTANVNEVSLGGVENVLKLDFVALVAQLCEYSEDH